MVGAQHGVFYIMEHGQARTPELQLLASYAFRSRKNVSNVFQLGEGLVGQAALEREKIVLDARAAGLHPDHLRPRRGAAAERDRAAGALRGRGEGGARAGLVRALQRHATCSSSTSSWRASASCSTPSRRTSRTEELLDAVAVAGDRAAEPPARAAEDERGAGGEGDGCSPSRTPRWSARTRRSSRPGRRSRRRPRSSR